MHQHKINTSAAIATTAQHTQQDGSKPTGLPTCVKKQRGDILDTDDSHEKGQPKSKYDPGRKWDIEAIKASASQHSTRSGWKKVDVLAYNAASRKGILNDVCSHMEKACKWNVKSIKASAAKHTTRSEWANKEPGAYMAARGKRILNDVCSHMETPLMKDKKWDINSIKASAAKYTNRSDWRKNNLGAYNAASKLGVLVNVCSHMTKSQ